MQEKLSIIIISYNSKEYVIDCIKSIIYTCFDFVPEIIIVDNNSTDDSVETISKLFPDVKIIENTRNLGYAKAINIGANKATGDVLILSNADVIYRKDSIQELVKYISNNDNAAVCGPQQVFPNGQFQRSFGYFPSIKRALFDVTGITKLKQNKKKKQFALKASKPYFVEYIDGAILCIKKNNFNSLNGFDEDYFFYSEEADFCYRANNTGRNCVIVPSSIVVHHRGGSQENKGMSQKGIQMLINSEELFLSKHKSKLEKTTYFTIELIYFKLLSIMYSILKKNIKSSNCDLYVEAIKNRREIDNEVWFSNCV